MFLPETQYMQLELESERHQGAHEVGGAPPPSWTGGGPPGLDSFTNIFYLFQKLSPWIFRLFWELLFLHKNNTMAVLLKTTSVRVSSIRIIQVRVQNKGKSVWKSRYDRDVSTPPSLNRCLSSSISWQTERKKEKLLQTLFALVVETMSSQHSSFQLRS